MTEYTQDNFETLKKERDVLIKDVEKLKANNLILMAEFQRVRKNLERYENA